MSYQRGSLVDYLNGRWQVADIVALGPAGFAYYLRDPVNPHITLTALACDLPDIPAVRPEQGSQATSTPHQGPGALTSPAPPSPDANPVPAGRVNTHNGRKELSCEAHCETSGAAQPEVSRTSPDPKQPEVAAHDLTETGRAAGTSSSCGNANYLAAAARPITLSPGASL